MRREVFAEGKHEGTKVSPLTDAQRKEEIRQQWSLRYKSGRSVIWPASLDLHGHRRRTVLDLRHPVLLVNRKRHVLDKVTLSPTERDNKRIRHDKLAVIGRFPKPEPFRRSERPQRLDGEQRSGLIVRQRRGQLWFFEGGKLLGA